MLTDMEPTPDAGPPLVITADSHLGEELLRLCAAAGVPPDRATAGDAAAVRQSWRQASAVLVGDDQAAAVAALRLPRRDDVVLIAAAPASDRVWEHGVRVHAEHVVLLPDGWEWLASRLRDIADGGGRRAGTIGVVGGSGGAGASTFAAALALRSAAQGDRTLLVDADPLAGGLDLVVGCETTPGLRWPDVAGTRGRVSAAAFRSALPHRGRLAVLSFGREQGAGLAGETLRAMLAAGQRGAELVVIDLARTLDGAAGEAALCCDVVILVTTAEVRAVAAAGALGPVLRSRCSDIRVVVRATSASGLSPAAVAETLGLPLLGVVHSRRSLAREVNEGSGPPSHGRFGRCIAAVLAELALSTPRRLGAVAAD